ncbi:GNAT family N-acetyltransferase [Bacillus marinisedimentorum]|uniref:GNAT family N-acetyltransferase n=1 Tax=Bacillus marinisedimentorum TaxID=1821260 RepID=UPI000871CDFA|nr:GNAT family N-acetyltransferase [Bacillus marinisedimentorum]
MEKIYTEMAGLSLEKARIDDLANIQELLVQAGKWLQEKGLEQWDYYVHDIDGNTADVIESIERGSTYLLKDGLVNAGTITVETSPGEWDRGVWEEEASGADAAYVHRLVVNRFYAGRGIGEKLLNWAEDHAEQQGKTRLRLDCLASNESLNAYYKRIFPFKGVSPYFGGHSKYEKRIGKPV